MFLTQKVYDIENFLQALSFIAPQGTSVAYFITPKGGIKLPNESGFQQQLLDTPEDESITYIRQSPVQKQDQAITPPDYSVFDPGKLGRKQPTPNILPPVTEPDQLNSPFVQVLSENRIYGSDIKLLEDYMMFPKGSVFHCVQAKLLEDKINPKEEIFNNIYKKSLNEMTNERKAGKQVSDKQVSGKQMLDRIIENKIENKISPSTFIEAKIQRDTFKLLKEGFSPEQIVEQMLDQKWYQKQLQKKSFGTVQKLQEYITDLVK
jgi:hypothetical protein